MKKTKMIKICLILAALVGILFGQSVLGSKEPFNVKKLSVDLSDLVDPSNIYSSFKEIVQEIRELLPEELILNNLSKQQALEIGENNNFRYCKSLYVKDKFVQKVVKILENNGYNVTVCRSPIITVDPSVDPPQWTFYYPGKEDLVK